MYLAKVDVNFRLQLQVFRTFSMRLEIELRCILFPLITLEMFLQLDWSPHVVNSIDWIWLERHTPVFITYHS
jgi:hypothetical protein